MSLLSDIQAGCVDENAALGPILLKLKYLAAKLESNTLAEWVDCENNGYPRDREVPDYRRLQLIYHGTFSNGFVTWPNMPIPIPVIQKVSSKKWAVHECRDTVAEIDELLRSLENGGGLGLDASSLAVLLTKSGMYSLPCVEIRCEIAPSGLAGIRHAVKSKVLDLTLAFESEVPTAREITLQTAPKTTLEERQAVTSITNQTIYGNVGVAATGDATGNAGTVHVGSVNSLVSALTKAGVPESDAVELAEIVSQDGPGGPGEPFSARAQKWIASKAEKIADGAWGMSWSVATDVAKQAAKSYFGM